MKSVIIRIEVNERLSELGDALDIARRWSKVEADFAEVAYIDSTALAF